MSKARILTRIAHGGYAFALSVWCVAVLPGHGSVMAQSGRVGKEAPKAESNWPPVPPQRPGFLDPNSKNQASEPAVAESPSRQHRADPECEARLALLGAVVDTKRSVASARTETCVISGPVALVSLRNPDPSGLPIRFPDKPLLACAMAVRLVEYINGTLQPLARDVIGSNISAVGTGPGYDCRPRNRQAGAKISSHGQGLAADIMFIEFAGKQRLNVEKMVSVRQEIFLKRLLETACATFNTVLGPASDSFHVNNVHIDLEPRGRDGKTKYCR